MNILEARRRTLGKGVYKKTVEGNPAIAQGSLARMYPGITMQGWTEQDSTTGANLFDLSKISSETATVDGNDILLSSYTNNLGPAELFFEPGTQYTIQATREAELQVSSGGMRLMNLSGDAKPVIFILSGGKGYEAKTVTTPDDLTGYSLYAYGWNNKPGENYRLTQPMIQKGSVATEYEPYTGRKPSPSTDYPQEIVSAGNWNKDTQKWEYEITIANEQTDPDKNQTVTLTADRPLTKWDKLEKRNGQWGWVYKSAEIVLDGSERWYTNNTLGGYIVYCTNTGLENGEFYISNFQESRQPNAMMDNSVFFYSKYFGFNVIAIRYDSAIDLNQFKNFLGQNSITLVAQTAEETFVPLSTSEQEQMNAIYTFRPTTVLSNDAGCNMTLTYKTKKSMEVAT